MYLALPWSLVSVWCTACCSSKAAHSPMTYQVACMICARWYFGVLLIYSTLMRLTDSVHAVEVLHLAYREVEEGEVVSHLNGRFRPRAPHACAKSTCSRQQAAGSRHASRQDNRRHKKRTEHTKYILITHHLTCILVHTIGTKSSNNQTGRSSSDKPPSRPLPNARQR